MEDKEISPGFFLKKVHTMEVGRGRSEVGAGKEDFEKKKPRFPDSSFLLNPFSVLSFLRNFEMGRKVVYIADSSLVQFKSSLIFSSCESKARPIFFAFHGHLPT